MNSSSHRHPGRLIIDEARSGTVNMATDEALLMAAEPDVATLRIYRWSSPTLSLGYFQSIGDRVGHAASRECDLVRRSSGGGAILHHHELTYSLIVSSDDAGRTEAANQLYRTVHAAVVQLLCERGLPAELQVGDKNRSAFLCFQRRADGDIICQGQKIMGSAQRRARAALAQHGSLLLARSHKAPELAGIQELMATPLAEADLVDELVERLGHSLGICWRHGNLTNEEQQLIDGYVKTKFSSPDWNHKR